MYSHHWRSGISIEGVSTKVKYQECSLVGTRFQFSQNRSDHSVILVQWRHGHTYLSLSLLVSVSLLLLNPPPVRLYIEREREWGRKLHVWELKNNVVILSENNFHECYVMHGESNDINRGVFVDGCLDPEYVCVMVYSSYPKQWWDISLWTITYISMLS